MFNFVHFFIVLKINVDYELTFFIKDLAVQCTWQYQKKSVQMHIYIVYKSTSNKMFPFVHSNTIHVHFVNFL